jgi:hypothetical protein
MIIQTIKSNDNTQPNRSKTKTSLKGALVFTAACSA